MSNNQIVADITELVKYVIYSDYILLDQSMKETPLSAILVAPVESGKTAILHQFVPTRGILCLSDLTAWGIQHYYLKQMREGLIKRILIPDMINPANRKQETVSSLITFFNSYISWEGVGNIVTYAMNIKLKDPLKGSLLTTMATKDFWRMRKQLAAVGFISRLLIIGYKNSQQVARDILYSIAAGNNTWKQYNLPLPGEHRAVDISVELAERLIPQAEYMGRRAEGYGARAMHQLKMLCKCRALSEGREQVNDSDVDRILHLAKLYLSRIPDIDRKSEKELFTEAEEESKLHDKLTNEEADLVAAEVRRTIAMEAE